MQSVLERETLQVHSSPSSNTRPCCVWWFLTHYISGCATFITPLLYSILTSQLTQLTDSAQSIIWDRCHADSLLDKYVLNSSNQDSNKQQNRDDDKDDTEYQQSSDPVTTAKSELVLFWVIKSHVILQDFISVEETKVEITASETIVSTKR